MEANTGISQTFLTSWEQTVLNTAKAIAEDFGDGKLFVFEELVDFMLDGDENSIKEALGSLTTKGVIVPLNEGYYDFQIKC